SRRRRRRPPPRTSRSAAGRPTHPRPPWCWCGTGSPRTPSTSASRAGSAAPLAEGIDVVIASPVRRTHESAEILGARLGRPVLTEEGLAEMEFGAWDGLTFAEIQDRYPDELDRWLGSLDEAPGGGESVRVLEKRVLASLERLLSEYAGRTV